MSEYKKYHIGNAHDEDQSSRWWRVPDYYPLTYDEVAELLKCAQATTDACEIASIELRLCQGVWGCTSGVPLHSPMMYAMDQIRRLYRQYYRYGPAPGLIEDLLHWMYSTLPGREGLADVSNGLS